MDKVHRLVRGNWSHADRMQIVQGQTCQEWIAWRWRNDCVTMFNQKANAEGQIQRQFAQEQFGKLRMGKSILNDWSWEVGFKTADLVQESKRRFGLVVRLIANEYYMDSFRYLSFLPPAIGPPSFAVQTFDLLLTSDQSPGSINKPNRWII